MTLARQAPMSPTSQASLRHRGIVVPMDESETETKNGRALNYKPRGMLRLDDPQYEGLRRMAFETHVPMTEIIRQGIELRLRQHEYNKRRRGKAASTVEA